MRSSVSVRRTSPAVRPESMLARTSDPDGSLVSTRIGPRCYRGSLRGVD